MCHDSFEINVSLIKAEIELSVEKYGYTQVVTALLELVKRKSIGRNEVKFVQESLLEIFPEVFDWSEQ